MKRRIFLRRAVRYCLLMLIPTLLLFIVCVGQAVHSEERQLALSGESTLEAVADNCSLTVQTIAEQNQLITGSSRILLSLQRMLFTDEISYIDSGFLYSIRTMLSSMVESNSAL